jgi:hypothetical protein
MPDFQRLKLEHLNKLAPMFAKSRGRICDKTPGAAFMWRDYNELEFTLVGGGMILKAHGAHGRTVYITPFMEDMNEGFDFVREYAKENNTGLTFGGVSDEDLPEFEKVFDFEKSKSRDWTDYLYSADEFIGLPGKKFRVQRNHISRFKRDNPEYSFVTVNGENIGDVRDFFAEHLLNRPKDGKLSSVESHAVTEVLDNFEMFKSACRCTGGILYSGDTVVGFSFGEVMRDTLFVHVEKANTEYSGVYQMLSHEFAVMAKEKFPEIKFINREEDVGDEGLRKSKLSYKPIEL